MLLCAALLACRNRPEAAAGETPQLEVRAAVGPAQTATAIAAVDGRVSTLAIQEGTKVQAGTAIATLVNPGIDRDVAYAKAQLAIAEMRLRDARRPIAQTLILGDSGARERASAEILKNRETKRDRYRRLFETHDISRQELEDAENEYAAALRDWLVERERASQKVIQTDTTVLQLELERARAELAFTEERRGLLEVKAPMTGTVTRVVARPGESVFARDPVAEISNTTTVEVRGTIAPELQRYIRAGMPVETKVFTVPPRRFTVPVKTIIPAAGGATLIVELPNPDGVLQEGQTATITVK